ncbi:DUF5689 domain-containing protein [uncultured Aquimarina sp.]|uniref:DUF5689 domain-containing protein n=1 Tax=uncultured Aquimarina sp. TaxID=575652 RepID=UPI0026195152|nr:DUF5689 domain-containing protein [uncultured Aquimarina sp.]
MKTNKIKTLIILTLIAVGFASCVSDDDFTAPEVITDIIEPIIDGTLTDLDAIKDAVAQEGGLVTFEDTANDLYVEGYVISSDASGNFFEEVIIQDKPENPTAGIRISANVASLFNKYEFGRKIYIKLEGLSASETNGVISLGVAVGNELGQLQEAQLDNFITRSTELATIVPTEVSIADFSEELENTYIKLSDMQFLKSIAVGEDRITFSGEPTDSFDGERTLESCSDESTVIVSTSTFADFKSVLLPQNRGSINAVLTRDFRDDFYTIIINNVSDINFDNEERCDPNVLECTGTSGGANVIFEEDFTGLSISDLENAGWLNVNTTGGSLDYFVGSFSGNQYAQISGFNSGESPFEVWLVTPEIDLTASSAEELAFDIQANFDNGNILTPFITNNFTGDVTTTEWTQLDASIPNGNPSGFGSFETVGPVNISCIDGAVRIAFRYAGADPGPTTRYHIDNISISGN